MLSPNLLQPGDTLLFRPGKKDWLGHTINWFEWRPGKGNGQYCHVAGYLGHGICADTNPGGPKTYPLRDLLDKADRIDVYRTMVEDRNPFDTPSTQQALLAAVHANRKDIYAYGSQIGVAAVFGILSRIGLDKFVQWRMKKDNPIADNKRTVCSSWWREVLETALHINIFPQYGHGRVKPSNWPESPYSEKIS